jgi:hypothetical protein
VKKQFTYFVSAFVLVVFSLYLVPHELVHAFYDHHDTEHCEEHESETAFSPVHIHCDFLFTDLTDFLPAESPSAGESSAAFFLQYHQPVVVAVEVPLSLRESRGPPRF